MPSPFPSITLKPLTNIYPCSGIPPAATESTIKYTVPTIHHIPSNKSIMESAQIAEFLESTYPDQPVPLTSELGREIESKARAVVGTIFGKSVMAREVNILSPRAGEYFRKTREPKIGRRLEELLANEDETWDAADGDIRAVGDLMQKNKADGPFLLGDRPSYTDFFIAGALQNARVIDEGVFQRIFKYDGYKQIYEACLPYMEKED